MEKMNYICFMAKGDKEIRITGTDEDLGSDLKKISDKKGYATLSAFLRVKLIEIRDENLNLIKSKIY